MAGNIFDYNSMFGEQGAQGERGIQGETGYQGEDGYQGYQGTQGAQGPRGTRGVTGPQGTKGATGIQGASGEKGTDGAQGARGCDGAQGAKGVKGAPGPQGERGENGAQGARGCDGVQGNRGVKGAPGPQGERGDIGVQGPRGCDGIQGNRGLKGAPGPQGERGPAGDSGTRGAQGTQGAQGPKGYKGVQGAKGTMGYQGDDGEIGIQGLTGENGAIWLDGIRLNGYNTHLFKYQDNKFVPVHPNDYLRLEDGATIKIWVNEAAYNAIKVNNEIVIDKVVNGEYISTNYKAYYVNGTYIASKINPEIDLNGIIEFTFNNNAWYYNGGLLSVSGEGSYGGGKDIAIVSGESESLIDISTDNEIEASVAVGNIAVGDKIPAGSSLSDILTQILVKEYQPATDKPTSVITVSPLSNTYSVGDVLPTLNIGHTYTDGHFKPSTGYPVDKFIEYNGSNPLNAGCAEGTTTYKYGNTVIGGGEYINTTPLTEGEHSFSCQTNYGASTVVAKTNLNHDSNVRINSGVTTTSTKTFNVWYNVYVVNNVVSLPDDYRTLMVEGNRTVMSSNTVLVDVEYGIESGRSMVIIIPTVKDFTIANILGSEASSEFKANHPGTVSDDNNVLYNIYYKTNASTHTSIYKLLTFMNQ